MHLPPGPNAAPTPADLLALIVAFGWEGLWVFWLGVRHQVWAECLLGLLMTVLLWRHIGMALRELLRAAHRPAVAL